MLIGFDKRFVFVASTKTASTSLEQVLRPHTDIVRDGTAQRKHIALRDIFTTYSFLFRQPDYAPESFFKFGVMRDPLDWILSWYRYRLGNNVESPLPEGMSFAEFWARKDWNILKGDGRKNLQRDMFLDWDGQVLADVIIPYDRLDKMFREICCAFGMPQQLPRANVSRIQETEQLPAGLEAEIRDFYAEDYELYAQLDEINAEGMSQLRAGQGMFRSVAGVAKEARRAAAPDRYVFVLSYCSEASGAVQKALNDLPGFCIRVGNNDTALHLMRARNAVAKGLGRAARPQPDAAASLSNAEKIRPWEYGRALADVFTQNILKPLADTQTAGFSSALAPGTISVLERYVAFLLAHFDKAQILFVVRKHQDAALPKGADPEKLKNIDEFYSSYSAAHPYRCHVIDYDDWISEPRRQTRLLSVLGRS